MASAWHQMPLVNYKQHLATRRCLVFRIGPVLLICGSFANASAASILPKIWGQGVDGPPQGENFLGLEALMDKKEG